MEKWIHKIEKKTCHKWGLESPHTIRTFRLTEKLRKILDKFGKIW